MQRYQKRGIRYKGDLYSYIAQSCKVTSTYKYL